MRKICIVTGSRAEYGLLHNLMNKIKKNKDTKLQTIVTCMHLLPKFGLTYKEITKDGFKIDYKVKMPMPSSKSKNITRATGIGLIGFSKAFNKLKPDLVVVLGDRFEILSAAFAALSEKIPIAHIGGGESTIGAIDESIRHSVTKMSSWHFVTTEKYRKRVIQLGEKPDRVYLVGSLGVDRIKSTKLLSKPALEKKINFKLGKKTILATYHPVTLDKKSAENDMKNLILSLKKFKNIKVIFSLPNADAGSDSISKMIKKFSKTDKNKYKAFKSMGHVLYLSAMKHSDLVLGNSSSGIMEAPTFKKPSINIGDRQTGRIKASSTIDCTAKQSSITLSIKRALSAKFKKKIIKIKNPYELPQSSNKIFYILKKINIKNVLKKNFYDLKF